MNTVRRIAVVTTGIDRGRRAVFEKYAELHSVEVVLFRFTEWWWKEDDCRYLDVRTSRRWGFKLPWWMVHDDIYIHLDPTVPVKILSQPWDAVVLYGYGSVTTHLAAWAARWRDIPAIMWSDGRYEYEISRSVMVRNTKRLLHRFAQRYLVSGSSARMFLMSFGVPEDRMQTAPYAIDNADMARQRDRSLPLAPQFRRRAGVDNNTVVYLYVGRVVRAKGVLDLIRAYAIVCGTVPKSALWVVGDGACRSECERLVKALGIESVVFHEAVNHDEIANYYTAADVLVLPSYRDVFPKVVNEAMVCQLPIIVTADVGSHRDLVEPGANGFVVRTGDTTELSERLVELGADRAKRLSMGRRSLEIISAWTVEAAASALARTLAAVIGEGEPSPQLQLPHLERIE